MEHEDVIFVGVCDLSGHMRGKAFPAVDLESRVRKGRTADFLRVRARIGLSVLNKELGHNRCPDCNGFGGVNEIMTLILESG